MVSRVVHHSVRLALLTGLLVGLGAGCGKHLYGRDDLTVDLAKHHIDLRWGRLENAAMRVTPEMRGPFVQVWASRLQSMEIQDLEVLGLSMIDEDTAEVVVGVTVVDKQSMGVKQLQFPEQWKRTEQGWQLATVAELPAG